MDWLFGEIYFSQYQISFFFVGKEIRDLTK